MPWVCTLVNCFAPSATMGCARPFAWILLMYCAAASALAKKSDRPECMWHDFMRHDNVSSWEFQAQPHRHMVRHRDEAIAKIEALLQQLTADPDSGIQFIPDSRWMAIFQEHSFQVSTRHGHPLHREDCDDKHAQPFPWKGVGYIRLRSYKLLTPASAWVPSAMPGTADLTLKMKKLDPAIGISRLKIPHLVDSAKLSQKVENDIHCDHGRPTTSPLFKPVSPHLNISKLCHVKDYFTNLADIAMLDEDEQLPFMHDVHRAKVVWTVVLRGVVGEANLVIKYNTTFEDAVAGVNPKNGEFSMRIRREVAEATGTTSKDKLYDGLDAIAYAMQVFRDAGWDGKTPALPSQKDKHGHRHCKGGRSGGYHYHTSKNNKEAAKHSHHSAHSSKYNAAAAEQDAELIEQKTLASWADRAIMPRAMLEDLAAITVDATADTYGRVDHSFDAGQQDNVAKATAAGNAAIAQEAHMAALAEQAHWYAWSRPWWVPNIQHWSQANLGWPKTMADDQQQQLASATAIAAAAPDGASKVVAASNSSAVVEGFVADEDFDYDEPVFSVDSGSQEHDGLEGAHADDGSLVSNVVAIV
eukprot:GHRR01001588.1.p1 GENE.GHRR01001588.1~~GHRR01001588.1.p1  ORF type:complete len:584 (+),score=186.17 GHRR01001588.1:15-1766(+)